MVLTWAGTINLNFMVHTMMFWGRRVLLNPKHAVGRVLLPWVCYVAITENARQSRPAPHNIVNDYVLHCMGEMMTSRVKATSASGDKKLFSHGHDVWPQRRKTQCMLRPAFKSTRPPQKIVYPSIPLLCPLICKRQNSHLTQGLPRIFHLPCI